MFDNLTFLNTNISSTLVEKMNSASSFCQKYVMRTTVKLGLSDGFDVEYLCGFFDIVLILAGVELNFFIVTRMSLCLDLDIPVDNMEMF